MAGLWKPFPAIIFCDSGCKDCFTLCVNNSLLILITALNPRSKAITSLAASQFIKVYLLKTASKTSTARGHWTCVQVADKALEKMSVATKFSAVKAVSIGRGMQTINRCLQGRDIMIQNLGMLLTFLPGY